MEHYTLNMLNKLGKLQKQNCNMWEVYVTNVGNMMILSKQVDCMKDYTLNWLNELGKTMRSKINLPS